MIHAHRAIGAVPVNAAGRLDCHLRQQRDGLLREAEYLEKRLKAIHDRVMEINTRIAPTWPSEASE